MFKIAGADRCLAATQGLEGYRFFCCRILITPSRIRLNSHRWRLRGLGRFMLKWIVVITLIKQACGFTDVA